MKFQFHFLLFAILILFSNCGSTQSTSSQTTGNNNPELMADKLTAEMVSQLKLSDEQTKKVKAINLKYIKKSQDLRKQSSGERSTMQSLRASIQKDKNAEMKQVLTESQYEKYESMQAESRGGRGQRGSGGRSRN